MAALLEECKNDLGFKGCEGSLRAILQKQLGFVFRKVDNKLKLEQKKIIKKRTKSMKPEKNIILKKKKVKQHSVPVQTQTLPMVQTVEIRMADGMDPSLTTTVHSIPVHRSQGVIEDIQMRHQNHQTDTIEHMALSGLVAHRTNVIENMAMVHRTNEMNMQPQQHQQQRHIEGLPVLTEYKRQ